MKEREVKISLFYAVKQAYFGWVGENWIFWICLQIQKIQFEIASEKNKLAKQVYFFPTNSLSNIFAHARGASVRARESASRMSERLSKGRACYKTKFAKQILFCNKSPTAFPNLKSCEATF